MDKKDVLAEIFADDPLNILSIKASSAPITADQRLVSSFQEINDFYQTNGRAPKANKADITEYQLHQRLNSLRENPEKYEPLKEHDKYKLLEVEEKLINSIEDIFDDDDLDILSEDDEGLFEFNNVPKIKRDKTDFVARRETCKDFDKYEQLFKNVHSDLKAKRRKLIPYEEKQLREAGNFFVHSGLLLYLESIHDLSKDRFHKADGRTRIIFENGTESNMKLRSLGKNLLKNGRAVTSNKERVDEDFIKSLNEITDEDDDTGFIYVLKSLSLDESISSINDLYKIGYSKGDITKRIKNAEHDPTYLMAPVQIIGIWECYNMNPQKFEQLLHNFFGAVRLDLDVYDDKGKRHRPQEWFIVPIEVINEAVDLLADGSIINYKYDDNSESIILK